jgi:hypothetical protein
MMKRLGVAALLMASLCFAKFSYASGDPISVTFDSFSGMEGKNGDTLDGSVKFVFANEGEHGQGEKMKLYYGSHGKGKTAEDRCRWILLGAFLNLQKKAKDDGHGKVVDITTASEANDPDQTSGDRGKCMCSENHWKASTLIYYRYAH